ncbi:hypothetical protein PROFUN_10047 [Planoprotostelium fungivorum]|uniref:Uncharacterized protein n=1 Tax=Planoprotostelium fungivorum TaxID=1890364 RepID=A0A2P6NFE4_9EUKA|nr:hypothetical protein PROFUN_10047 [Planoprotostelium fungivorum]
MRHTRNDTIKYLNDCKPQVMLELSKNVKRMRREDAHSVLVQCFKIRSLFPLEVNSSASTHMWPPIQTCPTGLPVMKSQTVTPPLSDHTESQRSRVSIRNLLC